MKKKKIRELHEKLDIGKIILMVQEFKILKLPFFARFDRLW